MGFKPQKLALIAHFEAMPRAELERQAEVMVKKRCELDSRIWAARKAMKRQEQKSREVTPP